ncbi:hypothetical protein HRbin32_01876 [bacterium HR32]|nr:hypothetical protein HRbin32_01876 [bacterium HR32]
MQEEILRRAREEAERLRAQAEPKVEVAVRRVVEAVLRGLSP